MTANDLVKPLLVIKHKYLEMMIGIEDKKRLLASIQRDDYLKDAFQQYEADISKLFEFEIAAF